jgi:hypothetical protein
MMIRLAGVVGTVACIVLLAVVLACAAPETPDSPESRAESARALARLSLELGSLDQALDRGAEWAQAASNDALTLELGRELTDEEQARVREILHGVLAEYMTREVWEESVVRVYAEEFTAVELDAITAFYGSPIGRKLLEHEAALSDRVDDEMNVVFEGQVEEFVGRIDDALNAEFGLAGDAGE